VNKKLYTIDVFEVFVNGRSFDLNGYSHVRDLFKNTFKSQGRAIDHNALHYNQHLNNIY